MNSIGLDLAFWLTSPHTQAPELGRKIRHRQQGGVTGRVYCLVALNTSFTVMCKYPKTFSLIHLQLVQIFPGKH